MTPEFICKVDENANVLEANEGFRPSSEIKMHMRVYKERPDVKSVVHAHPMYATSFACCGMGLTEKIMPEAVLSLGEVTACKIRNTFYRRDSGCSLQNIWIIMMQYFWKPMEL